MLIYVSPNKISNLLTETEVKANFVDYIHSFGGSHLKISGSKNGISTSAEIIPYERDKRSKDIVCVLKSLKRKGKLNELSINMQITPLSYISTKGTLEYMKFENGYTASKLSEEDLEYVRGYGHFFDDDILYFKIKVSHEMYDEIIIKCTVANIQVFGGKNLKYYYNDIFKDDSIWLRYPHSGDPGILYRKIPVEFVVWILDTNPNDRSIIGSPVIIYC